MCWVLSLRVSAIFVPLQIFISGLLNYSLDPLVLSETGGGKSRRLGRGEIFKEEEEIMENEKAMSFFEF